MKPKGSGRMRYRVLTAAIVAALLSVPGEMEGQEPLGIDLRDSVFVSADGDSVDAQFGILRVPERWGDADSNAIGLAFFRFPTTAEDPGPPIVYLAGGPGGSGIATARGNRFPLFMALREAGDVIALDQRGTGSSRPSLLCPEPWTHSLDAPKTRGAMLETLRAWSRACVQHFEDRGVDLAAYHTEASSDDVEALRRGLGAERLDLWGISYGTHLALSVLRRHPEGVRRTVLAGVEGPDHTLKLPSATETLLQRLDSLSRSPEGWTEGGEPLPNGFLDWLAVGLSDLEREPTHVPLAPEGGPDATNVRFDRFLVEWLLAASAGDSETLSRLPVLAGAFARGIYDPVAPIVAGALQRRARAMTFTTDCASGASTDRLARIEREAGRTLLGDAANFPFPDVCDAWPHLDLGPDFRAPVRSSAPTLFISGTLDGRTPPSNAVEVASGFSRFHHLVLDGASHDDDLLLSSPRIGEVILRFLRAEPISTEHVEIDFRFVSEPR